MKRIIRNITSAFALVALAASCSNSEIDELNNQPLDLPLSFSAEVSQAVSRAEGNVQAVNIGSIDGSIDFKLTVEGVERTMQLKSNGKVSYAEGNTPYTVSIKENETITKNCTIPEIKDVPLTLKRDGASFNFTSSLVGNATQLSISAKKQSGANRITASTAIPMKVNCSGLYIKVPEAKSGYVLYNNVEYPLVDVTGGSACFIKLESSASEISAGTDFAVLQINDGSVYKVQTTTDITPSSNSLFVMEFPSSQSTLSRTTSEQNTIYVTPVIEKW